MAFLKREGSTVVVSYVDTGKEVRRLLDEIEDVNISINMPDWAITDSERMELSFKLAKLKRKLKDLTST